MGFKVKTGLTVAITSFIISMVIIMLANNEELIGAKLLQTPTSKTLLYATMFIGSLLGGFATALGLGVGQKIFFMAEAKRKEKAEKDSV